MLITYVRSSSYNNYDYCQMQYFLTYVLGWRSESGKKADMGTMAHKVMEILAGLKKFQQDNPRKKYLEIVDDKCGKVRVSKDDLYTSDFVDEIKSQVLNFDEKINVTDEVNILRNRIKKNKSKVLNKSKLDAIKNKSFDTLSSEEKEFLKTITKR